MSLLAATVSRPTPASKCPGERKNPPSKPVPSNSRRSLPVRCGGKDQTTHRNSNMTVHMESSIETVDRGREILAQNPRFAIIMDNDFKCWIREGQPNDRGVPIATGRVIAQISELVFYALSEEMEHTYCSEFYQKRAMQNSVSASTRKCS
ncbi:hypothetical protein ACTMU2_14295 [Cupriavidus basilensis]